MATSDKKSVDPPKLVDLNPKLEAPINIHDAPTTGEPRSEGIPSGALEKVIKTEEENVDNKSSQLNFIDPSSKTLHSNDPLKSSDTSAFLPHTMEKPLSSLQSSPYPTFNMFLPPYNNGSIPPSNYPPGYSNSEYHTMHPNIMSMYYSQPMPYHYPQNNNQRTTQQSFLPNQISNQQLYYGYPPPPQYYGNPYTHYLPPGSSMSPHPSYPMTTPSSSTGGGGGGSIMMPYPYMYSQMLGGGGGNPMQYHPTGHSPPPTITTTTNRKRKYTQVTETSNNNNNGQLNSLVTIASQILDDSEEALQISFKPTNIPSGEVDDDEEESVPADDEDDSDDSYSVRPSARKKGKENFQGLGRGSNKKQVDSINKEKMNFNCDYCSYSTNRSSNLVIHTRLHTGEKPYKCGFPTCEYRAAHISNLRVHEKIHYR